MFSFFAVAQVSFQPNEIKQTFSWSSAGDVLKYEISIKRIDKKSINSKEQFYHETTEEETKNCQIYIDPALPAGKYSATIKIYNLLGILEEACTSSSEFTIYKAYQPEVHDVEYLLNKQSVIYLDDPDNDGIVQINGRNLFETDETNESLTYTDYFLTNGHLIIKPEEIISYSENNRRTVMRFNMKKLHVGKYYLIARDASGLCSEYTISNTLNVKFKKWIDIDIKAGYTLPFLLHDDTITNYFGTNCFPLSAFVGVSIMPVKCSWGYLGIGLRGSYTRADGSGADYTIDGNLIFLHGLLIFQKPFLNRRLIAELHAGAGITYFNNYVFHYQHNIDSIPLNTVSLSFDAGIAIQIFFNRRLFTEISTDYVFTLNKDILMGNLQPSIAIGWQF